jgi:small GTP-binding protein
MISKKVIITGSFGVGKTSIFTRFIENTFSEKYLTTIGVKVDKKTVTIDGREVSMIIWDIAGEVLQDKVPNTYFLGSSAVIYVFDLSRPLTFQNIETDLNHFNKILPGCIIRVVGNKKDLVDNATLQKIQREVKTDIVTSAKTGENVEELFTSIGRELLTNV